MLAGRREGAKLSSSSLRRSRFMLSAQLKNGANDLRHFPPFHFSPSDFTPLFIEYWWTRLHSLSYAPSSCPSTDLDSPELHWSGRLPEITPCNGRAPLSFC